MVVGVTSLRTKSYPDCMETRMRSNKVNPPENCRDWVKMSESLTAYPSWSATGLRSVRTLRTYPARKSQGMEKSENHPLVSSSTDSSSVVVDRFPRNNALFNPPISDRKFPELNRAKLPDRSYSSTSILDRKSVV